MPALCPHRSGRCFRRLCPLAALLLVVGVVTACAEEEVGPVFANQTPPTSTLPTPLPSPTVAAAGSPTVAASPVAERDLLLARGAPSRFYFLVGRELWTLAAAGGDARRALVPGPAEEIRAIAASPSGDRVAAVLATDGSDQERTSVVVVDAEGRELGRTIGVEAALGAVETETTRANSLDWSPQGDRLLVTFSSGGLVALPADGQEEPVLIVGPETARSPAAGAWSPTGEAIAFLDPVGGDASTGLYTAAVSPAPVPSAPPVAVWPPTPGRSVTDFAWTADGRTLLFAEGAAAGAPAGVGNLWQVSRAGDRRLVGSGGVAGPAAAIGELAPSPSGRAVAYVVTVPSEAGFRFHSLQVRDLTTNQGGFEILVPTDQAVTALRWTAAGLVIRVVPSEDVQRGDTATFALYLANGDGEPTRIFDAAAQTAATPPAATPAVPEGTPDIVPVSSPFGG